MKKLIVVMISLVMIGIYAFLHGQGSKAGVDAQETQTTTKTTVETGFIPVSEPVNKGIPGVTEEMTADGVRGGNDKPVRDR